MTNSLTVYLSLPHSPLTTTPSHTHLLPSLSFFFTPPTCQSEVLLYGCSTPPTGALHTAWAIGASRVWWGGHQITNKGRSPSGQYLTKGVVSPPWTSGEIGSVHLLVLLILQLELPEHAQLISVGAYASMCTPYESPMAHGTWVFTWHTTPVPSQVATCNSLHREQVRQRSSAELLRTRQP